MLRREPRGGWSDTRHSLRFAFILLMLAMMALNGPNLLYKYIWLDLESVHVPDHTTGSDPMLTIWRSIKSNHEATYTVTIREAVTNAHICSVSPSSIIGYKRAASDARPVLMMELSRWLDDIHELRKCERKGFGVGEFFVNTCHFKTLYGVPVARRCVESNTFSRYEVDELAMVPPPRFISAETSKD